MTLKCIIVDDERGSQSILKRYIAEFKPIQLVGVYDNAIEAFHYLRENQVDLIFLDINMPWVNGFELIDMIPDKPAVIFTTAHSGFALQGFDYSAVDYLLKPIRFERFAKAIDKVLATSNPGTYHQDSDHIKLKIRGFTQSVKFDDIVYVEALRNYVKLYFETDNVLLSLSITLIEEMLPRKSFLRIHKSYIVNTGRIKKIESGRIMLPGCTLPIGKTYRKYINESLK